MGSPEFDLWLSTHRSAGGLGEGSVGGEQRGQAAPTEDRLADALEPATGPDTLTTCEVRNVYLLLIVYCLSVLLDSRISRLILLEFDTNFNP